MTLPPDFPSRHLFFDRSPSFPSVRSSLHIIEAGELFLDMSSMRSDERSFLPPNGRSSVGGFFAGVGYCSGGKIWQKERLVSEWRVGRVVMSHDFKEEGARMNLCGLKEDFVFESAGWKDGR